MPLIEEHVRHAVSGDMRLRHVVPTEMLDRHPSLITDGLESDFDLCGLPARKACLVPAKYEAFADIPSGHFADQEDLAVGKYLDETTRHVIARGLEYKLARTARGKSEERIVAPPEVDFLSENPKNALG